MCDRSYRRARYAGRVFMVMCAALSLVASAGYAETPLGRDTGGDTHAQKRPIVGCGKAQALAARFREAGRAQRSGASQFDNVEDTDVLHYALDIEVSNIGGGMTISGSNRMTIRSLSPALTEFTFRLQDVFTITGAYVNDSIPVTITSTSWTTRVATLDRAYGIGEEFTLTIEYTGDTTYVTVTTQSGIPVASTLSEAWWAFTWWPAKDGDVGQPGDQSDKATLEFSITVPDNYDVPSNGLLQSVEPLSGGRSKYNWASDYPIATYLVSFSATEYNHWTEYYVHDGGSMPVEFYIYASDDNPTNRASWGLAVDMLETFAPLFGEYPFINEKYGIYNFPFGGGMEHQTMTGQGGGSFAFYEFLTAHELAHQWWGDMITCKTWSDIWLNEGFATYAECLWSEFKFHGGPLRYRTCMQDNRPYDNGAGDSVYIYPSDNMDEGRIFSGTYSYSKGGWVLHQLRHVVGDTAFFDILADYRAAYKFSAATTEEFIAIASSTYGQDLQWFFDQWVYNAGAPAYEYGWETENVGGQDYLRVRIIQTQEPPNPDVFIMPVDLVATIGGAPETLTVWNDARSQWYELPVSGPVTSLQFDPYEWILRGPAVTVSYTVNPPLVPPSPYDARKNRYISFAPNNTESVAFQVEMTASAEFPGSLGVLGWVGEPDVNEVSRVVNDPYFTDVWPAVVQVADCEIVPAATYAIRATAEEAVLSDPLEIGTILKPGALYYGDTVGEGTGDMPPLPGFTPPNGVVNVSDVQAYILTFQGPSSPSTDTTWVDLHGDGDGAPPNFIINVSDLQRIKFGFEGAAYGDTPQQLAPTDCP